ncbi:MAG: oxygenase MpaB family protein [Bryobacterales bacterium]|nr:oxygenase MpaB family protein [Bryobacterales bacterium]
MEHYPSAYTEGCAKYRLHDQAAADNYIRHTIIGDPQLDPVLEELSSLPPKELNRFVGAGIEQKQDVFRTAPQCLRNFFDDLKEPAWLDHSAFKPGVRAFHANVVNIFAAFVAGVLIDGFSTLISKSFVQTGRIFDDGVRRLRQNNRHQLEIFWPGGLLRDGEGWKLSIRIRFVHARVRHLLSHSEEWDFDTYGTPISAAHLGYALACFSARTLKHSVTLGSGYTREECESFCAVWRYAGYVMGIPETIIYTDEQDALKLYKVGSACEPPPSEDAIVMTNALIRSAPLVAGITDRDERAKLVKNTIYPVSRFLVGNTLADKLQFPKNSKFTMTHALLKFRLKNTLTQLMEKITRQGGSNLVTAFGASLYESAGLSYDLPDHAHSDESSKW